jgi:shikimate dehydrogenase
MKQYGLLGYPLSHSFSRGYFTEKFSKEGIDAVYDNFSIPSIDEFPDLLRHHHQLVGLNVTIPYKQAVIPFLNELDAEAREIGAVNVIRVERDAAGTVCLTGYNSDLIGFRESIRPYVEAMTVKPLRALVLGTGGASKAILFGLEQLGVAVQSVSRTPGSDCITYEDLTPGHYLDYSIVVNTTPLGMSPNVGTLPPLDYAQIGPDHLLFDAVYNPEKTIFLQKGEERGATIKNGLEMLHLQAEAAWKIWNRPL